jgi:hypothetical protein
VGDLGHARIAVGIDRPADALPYAGTVAFVDPASRQIAKR